MRAVHQLLLRARWALLLSVIASVIALPVFPSDFAPAGAPVRWTAPVGERLDVLRAFERPVHDYAPGHRGIDLRAPAGAAVHAPVAGTVTFVGTVVDRGVLSIRVDAHTVVSVEPVESDLRAGEQVERGTAVATVARGGHCADGCLHLGVRVDDTYVNPLRYFVGRPQLLPWGGA